MKWYKHFHICCYGRMQIRNDTASMETKMSLKSKWTKDDDFHFLLSYNGHNHTPRYANKMQATKWAQTLPNHKPVKQSNMQPITYGTWWSLNFAPRAGSTWCPKTINQQRPTKDHWHSNASANSALFSFNSSFRWPILWPRWRRAGVLWFDFQSNYNHTLHTHTHTLVTCRFDHDPWWSQTFRFLP